MYENIIVAVVVISAFVMVIIRAVRTFKSGRCYDCVYKECCKDCSCHSCYSQSNCPATQDDKQE